MLIGEGCTQKQEGKIEILWEAGKPGAILISKSVVETEKQTGLNNDIQVRLQNSPVAILGEYKTDRNENTLFYPLIPLTPGKRYEIFFSNRLLGTVLVPLPDEKEAPYLLNIYPTADTVPENLLKFYFQFSSPMREGEALQHIYLLDEKEDSIPGVFLDLQPELWNESSTALTLWLDPGRIKRGLLPNQKLGNPLKKGGMYKLVVADTWRSTTGLPIKNPVTKAFRVAERDNTSPKPGDWKIVQPKPYSREPLEVYFGEPLDFFLIQETLLVVRGSETAVRGSIWPVKNESGLKFIPGSPWQPGHYRLKIASYLEDLAGNNLNRPFDRDIKLQPVKETGFAEREFVIQ